MDKQQRIIRMFDDISPTYDRLNRVLSFGIDRKWRKNGCEAALRAMGKNPSLLIDVATGTGDLIIYWRKAAEKLDMQIGQTIGVDPSQNMLQAASQKVQNAQFIQSEAAHIPLSDMCADAISISYGIRNVVEIDKAITEFYRLLNPNGILLILEFMSREKKTFVDRAARFYLKNILPLIGKLISKNQKAYKYLPESIEMFFTNEEMVEKLKNAGFEIVEVHDETFKISTRFIAKKPQ
ncbi:ubiquinone/menaquinone biosynthesis C-methyltransferase UbiE [Campylobacterota bacterium]|nr:ubiquinone/menaquinone biosynthesis C-methyltransferase UbiE [Campylobacterota bacterium]